MMIKILKEGFVKERYEWIWYLSIGGIININEKIWLKGKIISSMLDN